MPARDLNVEFKRVESMYRMKTDRLFGTPGLASPESPRSLEDIKVLAGIKGLFNLGEVRAKVIFKLSIFI